jgi:acyl-CoA synthetase (AMP-forming)/AMP-acid ligase II
MYVIIYDESPMTETNTIPKRKIGEKERERERG